MKEKLPIRDVTFSLDDKFIYYSNAFGFIKKVNISMRRVVASSDFWSRGGIFELSPDRKYIATFTDEGNNKLVNYGKYFKVEKVYLKILNADNIRLVQKLVDFSPCALNAKFSCNGRFLYVSDFEGMHIFKSRNF